MRYSTTETTNIVSRFPTGSTVTIDLYDLSDGSAVGLDDDSCTEIGATGYFYWNTDNITTYPNVRTEYLWVTTDTHTESAGKIIIGGWPDYVRDMQAQLNRLVQTAAGTIAVENPWVVGELPSGGSVTLTLYDSTGTSVTLSADSCSEIGATGFYRWSTSNMADYPETPSTYLWVMRESGSGRRDYGIATIGPVSEAVGKDDVAEAVWDALLHDHKIRRTFGEAINKLISDGDGSNLRISRKR